MNTGADPAQAPRVVIADDQMLVRSGFRLILSSAGIPVVAEAADGKEAVTAALKHQPDVMLMDIRMPEMDGLEATKRILASRPGEDMRIIILTTFDLDQYVYSALSAGASGFLLKDVSPEHLIAAVRLVRSGDALLAPSITRRLVERFAGQQPSQAEVSADLSVLTPRELEVLGLIARGLSNAELATELTLSEATVKTHVARILTKLQLRDRVQAVVLAYETGLVSVGQNHGPGGVDLETFGRPLFAEAPFRGVGFGLGFAVLIDPVPGKVVGSAGELSWGGAASTSFWVDREADLTVSFFTQLLPSSTHPIRPQLRQLTYQALTR